MPETDTTPPVTAEGSYDWWRTEVAARDADLEHLRHEFEEMTKLHDAKHQDWQRSEGELGRLRNRITALEANGSELLARAEQAEAVIERMRAQGTFWAVCAAETVAAFGRGVLATLDAPESNAPAPSPVTAATDTNLRERLHEAISGSWSTMPTCWETQTSAVLAVLHVEDDMDLRELIGPMLDAAQVRDADGVTALVVDVIWPEVERLRAERDAAQAAVVAQAATEAPGGGRGRSVLDRVSDWAENALDAPVTAATEAHGEAGGAKDA